MPLPQLTQIPHFSTLTGMFSRREDGPPTFIVVDVGASTIRAMVCESRDDQLVVLGKSVVVQEADTMYGGVIAQLETLVEALGRAIDQAQMQAGRTSDQLVLGLGGALVGGVTTLVHLNRPDPKSKMTDKELQTVLERICETALVDAEHQVAEEMGLDADALRLINSAVTSISLDGYTLASPLGFSGKEMDVCLFNAFTNQSTLVALQKMLADLNVDLTALASEPYALAQAVIAVQKKPRSTEALIVDVGAGTTSVTLVHSGAVVGSKAYMLGGRAVTARIAQALAISLDQAETSKLDYAAGKASSEQQEHVRSWFQAEAALWLKGLRMALAEFDLDVPLPTRILLTGRASLLPEIGEALAEAQWSKGPFTTAPTIERLTAHDFPYLADDQHLLDTEDVPLAALSHLLVDRQHEDDRVATMFQKALRSLE